MLLLSTKLNNINSFDKNPVNGGIPAIEKKIITKVIAQAGFAL